MLLARLTSLAILTVVATLAFVLSFTALADLAARNAVPRHQAWMVPVVVDATIVAATLAVVTLRHRRWYAWSLLGLAATLSVAGNVAHAWSAGVVAVVVAAVPPLFLLAMTELAVLLARDPQRRTPAAPLLPHVELPDVPDLAGSWRAKNAPHLVPAA
ncbi:DUF2637 domain-containing protein [Rhodococcoides corynebacterioides]|uniref:DUF2637 domain-containing protein n=1 Tax=Rhodococcoides corynebacterioides TaxID=53972 RepID=UPI003F80FD31